MDVTIDTNVINYAIWTWDIDIVNISVCHVHFKNMMQFKFRIASKAFFLSFKVYINCDYVKNNFLKSNLAQVGYLQVSLWMWHLDKISSIVIISDHLQISSFKVCFLLVFFLSK